MSIVDEIHALAQAEPLDSAALDALEAALDGASHEERVEATRRWSKGLQARLFEAAHGRGVPYEQMVPTDAPLQEVIHVGTNSLPAFRNFEKRFCRPGRRPELEAPPRPEAKIAYGYNHTGQQWATGPGYYVAYPDSDSGEFVVDYHQLPEEKPASWPSIVSNRARLGLFVYAGMIDRLRRLSRHVTVGRAFKKKPMDAWFVLVRDDASFGEGEC